MDNQEKLQYLIDCVRLDLHSDLWNGSLNDLIKFIDKNMEFKDAHQSNP